MTQTTSYQAPRGIGKSSHFRPVLIWLNTTSSRSDPSLILIPDLPLDCPSLADVLPLGRCFSVCSSPIWLEQADKVGVSVFPQLVYVCHCCDIVQFHLNGHTMAVFGKTSPVLNGHDQHDMTGMTSPVLNGHVPLFFNHSLIIEMLQLWDWFAVC